LNSRHPVVALFSDFPLAGALFEHDDASVAAEPSAIEAVVQGSVVVLLIEDDFREGKQPGLKRLLDHALKLFVAKLLVKT
jgi:hypothetical protein